MFDLKDEDWGGYNDEGCITILYKPTTVKNKARESSSCAFLWKPDSEVYTGKWKRVEYNNSSPFAFWWVSMTDV